MSSAHSRSSAAVTSAIDAATSAAIAAVREQHTDKVVVLIDGRSGAGKSTLMRRLVDAWPASAPVQAVALDLLYPGWEGLAAGAESATTQILRPHSRGEVGVWQRWDWEKSRLAEAHAVAPSVPLIIEGCGILTPSAADLAEVRIWMESPLESRRDRALTRDGDVYRPHWARWAEQEDAHIAAHAPRELATLVVDVP